MNHLRVLLISAAVLAMAGCASPDQGWMGSPLKDTSWQLMTIESKTGDAGRDYVANKADVRMTLLASGDAKFTLGCEQGSTDWRAGWERIETQGEIHFDEMLIDAPSSPCEPNLVVQRFLRDVQFMDGYVLIQNHLYLNTQANETTYGWRKIQAQ
jgi:hypothetical protein